MELKTMQVLGDGEVPAFIDSECNDIANFPDGLCLWQYVLSMLYGDSDEHKMYSARYHQHQTEEGTHKSTTCVFPAHLDKAFVTSTMFLPLTNRTFFTFIAVPATWYITQHTNSFLRLREWLRSLPPEEKQRILDFIRKFESMAETFMKVDVEVRVFVNTVGSMLLFPANICFHTTITPGATSNCNTPRDLFIIHTTSSATTR